VLIRRSYDVIRDVIEEIRGECCTMIRMGEEVL
jgi:hypothetical protein